MRRVVQTGNAPEAIGSYSQAIVADSLVWISGQIGLDPATGSMVPGGVEAEARQVMRNLEGILEAAGSGFDRVVRATIYLADMDDFAVVNEIYGSRFGKAPPSRACVQVSRLPRGARVEVDAVATAG